MQLLSLGVSEKLNHLHPVFEGGGNRVSDVSRGDEEHLGKVEGDIKIMVNKGEILLRVQNLEQCCRRVAPKVDAHLVNLVEHEYGVIGLGAAESLQKLKSLNEREDPGQVTRDKILERAKEYIAEVEPITKNIENFGLACIQEGWKPGVEITLKLSGNLISISGRPRGGRVIKYAQGAPSLMAWRMLCLCGAKALDDDELDLVSYVLREPIEVEEASGRFSNRPLAERRDLFYPEAFLGYANFPMPYMDGLWDDNPHLKLYFDANESYQLAIAKFFILVVLAASPDEYNRPLYPGYRSLKQAGRAMSSLTSRMFSSPDYFKNIAQTIGISGADLMRDWTERAKLINSVPSGEWHPLRHEVSIPEKFGQDIQ